MQYIFQWQSQIGELSWEYRTIDAMAIDFAMRVIESLKKPKAFPCSQTS